MNAMEKAGAILGGHKKQMLIDAGLVVVDKARLEALEGIESCIHELQDMDGLYRTVNASPRIRGSDGGFDWTIEVADLDKEIVLVEDVDGFCHAVEEAQKQFMVWWKTQENF